MSVEDRVRETVSSVFRRIHQDVDGQAPRLAGELSDLLRAEHDAWREGHIAAFTRLLSAVRVLDEATTLSGVLTALASGAIAEASRVAVLLLDEDRLRFFGHLGFAVEGALADITLGRRSPFDAAIERREAVDVEASADDVSMPAFLELADGHAGRVVPMVVGGNVVAVVYADGLGRRPGIDAAPIWPEQLDILVRHAALRLENVTSIRTVEVLSGS